MTLSSSKPDAGDDPIAYLFRSNPIASFFSDISPSCLFLLDTRNRFVITNQRMLDFLGAKTAGDVEGKDFGILYRCVENETEETVCGMNPESGHCAFFRLLTEARRGALVRSELTLDQYGGKSIIFSALLKRIVFEGRDLVAVSMLDITDRKRREMMERMFYHDLINAVSGMTGLLQLTELSPSLDGEAREMIATSRGCAEYLADEILFARNLSRAEKNELTLEPHKIRLNDILLRAIGFFRMHVENGKVRFQVNNASPEAFVLTDRTLVVRILVNLIKNAMEASQKGSVVGIRAKATDSRLTLEVHNGTFIPPEVSENIFVRAFTTKGVGRGVGTYSVRLFAEYYLHGKVWFTTDPLEGTSFFVEIPCEISGPAS